ncbi:MAG: LLM class flavin-dependent oxidoreductase [Gammaproteobacteria bacterium]
MKVRIGLTMSGMKFDSAADVWTWVDACEASRVDSLWQSDRLIGREPHIEAMSLMAALAGRTRRLKFGMSVVAISFRDPLVLAKECATIDFLSGGRFLPAFGLGAPQLPEWKAVGRSPKSSARQADEALELLTRLWSEEDVSFAGEHYHYERVTISPKPVQKQLPLWIGGNSAAAIRRTARFGTGWIGGIQTADEVAPVVEGIKREAERLGRWIDPDHYGASFSYRFGTRSDPIVDRAVKSLQAFRPGLDAQKYFIVGGAQEILQQVQDYVRMGVTKFVLRPMAADMADLMEQTRRLAEEVIPIAHN